MKKAIDFLRKYIEYLSIVPDGTSKKRKAMIRGEIIKAMEDYAKYKVNEAETSHDKALNLAGVKARIVEELMHERFLAMQKGDHEQLYQERACCMLSKSHAGTVSSMQIICLAFWNMQLVSCWAVKSLQTLIK
jgi:hypothetical protein